MNKVISFLKEKCERVVDFLYFYQCEHCGSNINKDSGVCISCEMDELRESEFRNKVMREKIKYCPSCEMDVDGVYDGYDDFYETYACEHCGELIQ